MTVLMKMFRMEFDLFNIEVIRMPVIGNGIFHNDHVVVQHWAIIFRRLVQVDQNT